eukprot:gene38513-43631_t
MPGGRGACRDRATSAPPRRRGWADLSTPTVAISVLPQAVTAWRKEFPGARCELATHHTSEIVNTLRLGEADLALSLQDPRHPGIVAEPLAQGVMTVIAPAGTWSAADSAMPLTAPGLAGELIGHADNDPLGEMVVAACEAQGLHPVFHTVVQTYQIARSLVEAGGGMAVVDPFTANSAAGALVKEVKRAMQHGHPQMTIADLLGNPLPADLVNAQ